ncbi:MAG TPA: ABC transporter permease [Vicinamibacterales bacterium]|nr:ABC transporter permease [Vicinamibacterales bacterium]
MSQLKLALRTLRLNPTFTVGAVLTIALGIGANTALFSVFDRLILRPITLQNPGSLVALWVENPALNLLAPAVSWPRYEDIRASAKAFATIADSAFDNFTLTGNGDPQQLNGLRVTASFLSTIGITPAFGRNFTPEEDVPNGPNVCILSHELWKTQFGSRPSIIGETIQLNGQSWEVVGILPPRLSNPFNQTQVLAPRVSEVTGLTKQQVDAAAGYSQPVGRLKPGVTLEQAAAELKALDRSYHERFATRLDANNAVLARNFVETLTGNLRPTFYTLLGAVGVVLLIACANVAALFLSKISARQKEIAIRQALGASRTDVIAQFLTESLVLAAIAGFVGTLFAMWALSAIQWAFAKQLPQGTALSIDWRSLVFTAGVTLASALLVGIVPSWQASRSAVGDVLKDAGRGSSPARGGRFRAALVVAEVALSTVLLVGAGLLLASFVKLQRTPPGFEPRGVATAFVGVPVTRYPTNKQQAEFFTQVIDRLRSTPGVRSAAAVIGLPLSGFNPRSPYAVGGREVPPLPQRPIAQLDIVSDDYFNALRIPIRQGRGFNAADRDGAPQVCVINETFAKRLFPGESPLGHTLLRGAKADVAMEIVGIAADVKSNGLNAPAPDEIYYPMPQLGRPGMAIIAATDNDPAALQAVMRSAVASVDKDQPISVFATLDSSVAQSLGNQKILASLTAMFAAAALALAALGLYSVVAYAVAQRTGEIGIRMALGAQPRQVVALELSRGLKLVVAGLVAGLASSAGAGRLIRTLLFDVQPLDPVVYASVAALFALVATLACLAPSLRVARIDPLVALRAD